MDFFNHIINAAFDILLYPFGSCAPVWGLMFLSIVTGALMVWLFGRISNQQRVTTLKATMKGHLLEVWIFRDQLRNVLKAEKRVMRQTCKYLLCSLPAFMIIMLPVVLIMIQLQARYGCRPLQPGERVVLKIHTAPAATDSQTNGSSDSSPHNLPDVRLQMPEGLTQETPALRIPRDAEIDFRIGAVAAGQYQIGVELGDERVDKTIDVGTARGPLSSCRSSTLLDRILDPIEPGVPQGRIVSVEFQYPEATVSFAGYHIHWIWLFLIVSMAAGYALKGVFGVEL